MSIQCLLNRLLQLSVRFEAHLRLRPGLPLRHSQRLAERLLRSGLLLPRVCLRCRSLHCRLQGSRVHRRVLRRQMLLLETDFRNSKFLELSRLGGILANFYYIQIVDLKSLITRKYQYTRVDQHFWVFQLFTANFDGEVILVRLVIKNPNSQSWVHFRIWQSPNHVMNFEKSSNSEILVIILIFILNMAYWGFPA